MKGLIPMQEKRPTPRDRQHVIGNTAYVAIAPVTSRTFQHAGLCSDFQKPISNDIVELQHLMNNLLRLKLWLLDLFYA